MKHPFTQLFGQSDWIEDIEAVASCITPNSIADFMSSYLRSTPDFASRVADWRDFGLLHSSGDVWVSETAKIGPGVVIEGPAIIGPGAKVGPNSYLRGPVFIGELCEIGFSVEIKHSIIMSNVILRHFVYIGNSIIGNYCNLGANFVTAVSRLDNEDVFFRHLTRKILIGKKAGCIMGDRTISGVNVTTMPGRIIPADSILMPGTIYYGR